MEAGGPINRRFGPSFEKKRRFGPLLWGIDKVGPE